uniref:Uncharacterized protein n=1 Tax=Sus scrofa TaxID=9823 RepID=A0A8D1DST2_PIG
MAGHLASDFAFSPPPGGGGDGPGGPEPGWVDPRTWLSFQGPPGGSGIGPGVGPGAEVWGLPACPPPYDFCGGMAYCAPQVGVGLVPQGGLETPQPEGEAGAGVESNSEGASPEPCAVLPLPRADLGRVIHYQPSTRPGLGFGPLLLPSSLLEHLSLIRPRISALGLSVA